MKLTTILSLLLASFASFSQETRTANDYKKLEWLVGTWNRTNITRAGRSGNERWEMTSNGQLMGMGVTLQATDTIFVEKASLLLKDGAIYYVADVPENKEPVFFKLTAITSNGFVCENPTHDFPKKISYQLEGLKLTAQISGDGKSFAYTFERSN